MFPAHCCPLQSVEITVGMQFDEFLLRQALRCHDWFKLPALQARVICAQRITGRYLTIQEMSEDPLQCMSLCDVNVYTESRYLTDRVKAHPGACKFSSATCLDTFKPYRNLVLMTAIGCGPYNLSASELGYLDYRHLSGGQCDCTWVITAPGQDAAVNLTVEVLRLATSSSNKVCKIRLSLLMAYFWCQHRQACN